MNFTEMFFYVCTTLMLERHFMQQEKERTALFWTVRGLVAGQEDSGTPDLYDLQKKTWGCWSTAG